MTTGPRAAGTSPAPWPELPWRDWEPTVSTLHLWLQIVGKVRLALAPPLNHWWHVPLYVTARGLTTSPVPYGGGAFQVDLDFVEHRLRVTDGDPAAFSMALEPRSVARFYRELHGRAPEPWHRGLHLAASGGGRGGDPVRPGRASRLLRSAPRAPVLAWPGPGRSGDEDVPERIRRQGEPGPFFWGGFDLASSRFSGRPAPRHPGGMPNCPDWVMDEAEAAEQSVAGFWPGRSGRARVLRLRLSRARRLSSRKCPAGRCVVRWAAA